MRLQLIAVMVGLGLTAPAAAQPASPGEGRVAVKGSTYIDDDDTVIVTTLVDGAVGLPGRTTIGAHALVDSISSASVDVVSAATPSFEEVRIEVGLNTVIAAGDDIEVGLGLTRSVENDWLSYSPQASFAIDFAQRNTRLTAGYGLSHSQVGRAGDPAFDERLIAHTVELGLTQVLDERSLLSVAWTMQRSDGFHSSPYRFVTTSGGDATTLERHPDVRHRQALTATALHQFARRFAIEGSYRLYLDDWGMVSHTGIAALRMELSEAWSARLRVRAYTQSAVEFWQEQYEVLLDYVSADRELSTFWDIGAGIKVAFRHGPFHVDLKAHGQLYRFQNFAPLEGRVALIADLGLGVAW